MDSVTLRFLGAAETVTGSRTVASYRGQTVMVDCGMFQGAKPLRLRNWLPSPISPKAVSAVLLTHGHLDHCGLLPRFVAEGFEGTVFASAPTKDVAEIILRDSARIQEEDADLANRLGFSRHKPALPLYTQKDVDRLMPRFETVAPDEWIRASDDLRFRMRPSGHILGSTLIELETPKGRIAFTGDLGRARPLLLPPPAVPEECATLVLESTYGDRLHAPTDPKAELAEIATRTLTRGGKLIIPSFAVERAQELLFLFNRLRREKKIPRAPLFLDTPMGANVTELFAKHPSWHSMSAAETEELTAGVEIIRDAAESRENVASKAPAIIIAGSGMVTGGRVLRYIEQHGGDPDSTILMVGFQTPGTRGRALLDGAKELKFYGAVHPIRAEVRLLENLSAHADQAEILEWLQRLPHAPRLIYLNHGEPEASAALAEEIRARLSYKCRVAKMTSSMR